MNDPLLLDVLLYGETIGILTHLPGDKNLFTFADGYADNPKRRTLSLSFRDVYGDLITTIKPTRTRLPPFFSNLLPEGRLRDFLAEVAQVSSEREFFLLTALGQDLPGAVRVIPHGEVIPPVEQSQRKPIEGAILHFSLAGVQMKFSADKEDHRLTIPAQGVGGEWIIKLPSREYEGVPENEFAMMELARRMGMDVPETALVAMDQISGIPEPFQKRKGKAYIIRRFDRNPQRHIEDFAQIFAIYPEKKYRAASYVNIAKVIWAETGEGGFREFLRRFIFNTLIGNGDMHLKNWSLVHSKEGQTFLAPAYDFVSTLPYIPNEQLALTFIDTKEFNSLQPHQLVRFASKVSVPEKLVVDVFQETTEAFFHHWPRSTDLPISKQLRQMIDSHLKTFSFGATNG
ncbi:MAG: type II toxin-antitoxin system HipA family toxin [Chlamydiia bacterium]|nr:type II toxin-antitoxin system HipA family toxin [Chlamydiia bacterium]